MIYVLLSVCCSVSVSILLKMARRYNIDIMQAIAWNYSMALFLTWVIYRPNFIGLHKAPIFTYGTLTILFPGLFIIIGLTVRYAGIIRTDIAQRLSLFISLIAAFFLFNEQATPLKLIGLVIGFTAVIFSVPWQRSDPASRRSPYSWLYLLMVFAGFGVIDVLLRQIAVYSNVPFTTSLFIIFGLAFIFSQLVLLYLVIRKKIKFTIRHIFFGWILGTANFGNILFYLKAHHILAANPSVVFSVMNIGVILLSTVIGLMVFKEKLSTLNKLGIALAVAAVAIIGYSKTH